MASYNIYSLYPMINSRGKHTRTYTRATHSQSLCSSVLCVPLSKCPHFPFFIYFSFKKKTTFLYKNLQGKQSAGTC